MDLQALLLVLVVWSALALLAGCQSDPADPVIEPEETEVGFDWYPEVAEVGLTQGQEQLFKVIVSGTTDFSASWTLGGATVGTGDSYTFEAADPGQETLHLEVTAGGATRHREWFITVGAVVTGISILHGDEPAEVVVRWNPIPDGGTVEPVTQYLVGVNYSGPITEENWPDATLLGDPIPAGEIYYERTFTEAQGIVSGAEAWFMVRGLDAVGGLTPVIGEFPFEISFPWYVEGFLRDDANLPVGSVSIYYNDEATNSDASGYFLIGPLFNFETVDLETRTSNEPPTGEPYTSWYDPRWPTFGYGGNETMDLDIHLITRYGLDDSCTEYDRDFLNYLRKITRNILDGDDFRLFTWAEYPVSIYVPSFVGPFGFDMQGPTQDAAILWNTLLREDYFEFEADPDLADVVVEFKPQLGSRFGYTTVELPLGETRLGDTIPEKMLVEIDTELNTLQLTEEIALHEFGHVLGFWDHSSCSSDFVLMRITSAPGSLDYGEENAIHVDELRAVRAIRYLPQAVDMSIFETPPE